MKIDIKEEKKRINIWLTRSESIDDNINSMLTEMYKKYNDKRYMVCVFKSGDINMKSLIMQYLQEQYA